MSLIRTTMAALALSVSALGAQAADVKWASRADIYSLDPNSIASTANLAFLNHIYEGLVRYDKNLRPGTGAGHRMGTGGRQDLALQAA